MGIFALSAIIMAGTGFFIFFQSITNLKPGQRKIQADLKSIREETLKLISSELTPVRKEDLELISLKETMHKEKKWVVRNVQGLFHTIFEEPVIAYYSRWYPSGEVVLFAKTDRHEFFYWLHGKMLDIVVDEAALGAFYPETGELLSARTKKTIARLEKGTQGKAIYINDRQVGRMALLKPNSKDILSQRVFDFVVNELSAEEEAIILALSISEMIQLAARPASSKAK